VLVEHVVMIVFPCAKINIGLRIVSKRSDGYHDLESLFYPLPLCDILEIGHLLPSCPFFVQTGLLLACREEDNLVVKAFRLMQSRYSLPPVAIHLHKVIPSGAGLGGGSSDAAFMIRALNEFFHLDLSAGEMRSLALSLGSDCPFFIDAKPSLVKGRGELLFSFSLSLTGKYCVVVVPPFSVQTAEAYSLIQPRVPEKTLDGLLSEDISRWENTVINDFEKPLFRKYSMLENIKQSLYQQGALYASLSGSGSALYGLFEEPVNIHFPGCFVWQGWLD